MVEDKFPWGFLALIIVVLLAIAAWRSGDEYKARHAAAAAEEISPADLPLITVESCRKFLVAAARDQDNDSVLVWNACLGIQALEWCELPADAQRILRRHGAVGRVCPQDIAREERCNALQINPETDNGLTAAELNAKSRKWAECMGFEVVEWCELDPASRQALVDMGAPGRTCT